MPPKIARLAGLGAYAASAGIVVIFLLVSWASRHTPLGGMTDALAWVTWISLFVVTVLLIAAHIAIGKQLMYMGKGGGPRGV